MRRVLVDTAVFAYALGARGPEQVPAVEFLRAAADGKFSLHASVEMVQELLHHRLRTSGQHAAGRSHAVAEARAVRDACTLHPFDAEVLSRSIELMAMSPALGGRDAVHAATAVIHGIDTIVSPDRAFDGVAGLHRVTVEEILAR